MTKSTSSARAAKRDKIRKKVIKGEKARKERNKKAQDIEKKLKKRRKG